MTFKSGGLGINLTGANHVICATSNYNPTLTDQAIGRVHRMGQKKEVFVYRLVTATTIEESTLKLNLYKTAMAQSLIDDVDHSARAVFAKSEFTAEMLYLVQHTIEETIKRIQLHHGVIGRNDSMKIKAHLEVRDLILQDEFDTGADSSDVRWVLKVIKACSAVFNATLTNATMVAALAEEPRYNLPSTEASTQDDAQQLQQLFQGDYDYDDLDHPDR